MQYTEGRPKYSDVELRILQEAALCNPEVIKACVELVIKQEAEKTGDYTLMRVWLKAQEQERYHMNTNTMNAYGLGMALTRLADAGLVGPNVVTRPRSWSTKYFAIEVTTEGPSPYSQGTTWDRTYGKWDRVRGIYAPLSTEPSKVVTKLYSLDDVDAFIAKHRPTPVEVVGLYAGNNQFSFPIEGGYLVNPSKSSQWELWTLSQIRSTNGEVTQDGKLYRMVPPRDLFRTQG